MEPLFNFFSETETSESEEAGKSEILDAIFAQANAANSNEKSSDSFFFGSETFEDPRETLPFSSQPSNQRDSLKSSVKITQEREKTLSKEKMQTNGNVRSKHKHQQAGKAPNRAPLAATEEIAINQPKVPLAPYAVEKHKLADAPANIKPKYLKKDASIEQSTVQGVPVKENQQPKTTGSDKKEKVDKIESKVEEDSTKLMPPPQIPKPSDIVLCKSKQAITSSADLPSKNNIARDDINTRSPQCETNAEVLSMALKSSEYQLLNDQLSNLHAAKLSGNFVYQVASSVDALFKCSESVQDKTMAAFEEKQSKLLGRMGGIKDTLQAQLEELNRHHQAIVDSKLSKLSSVLDEIKTNHEELNKYKHLLQSLSLEVSTKQ